MVAGEDGAAPRQRAAQVRARGSQQVRALSGVVHTSVRGRGERFVSRGGEMELVYLHGAMGRRSRFNLDAAPLPSHGGTQNVRQSPSLLLTLPPAFPTRAPAAPPPLIPGP